jgi:hypothetical protein
MNIYKEAARRYDGGVFKFPDCPECGAGYLKVVHVPNGYKCEACGWEWLKHSHRQMAEALWVELQRVTKVANTVGGVYPVEQRTYCGQHCTGQDDCPFCKADRGEI